MLLTLESPPSDLTHLVSIIDAMVLLIFIRIRSIIAHCMYMYVYEHQVFPPLAPVLTNNTAVLLSAVSCQ